MILAILTTLVTSSFAVDLDQIQKELRSTGAVGWIHGSVESQGLYVFTYRNPDNFFDYAELSLTSEDTDIQKKFAALARHDQVIVKGDFLPIKAPQKHIAVTSIELLKKFDSGFQTDPYQHHVTLPDDLLRLTHATFLVHAVAAEGQVLVVEYKDVILPIFIKNGALTKNLFRGDLVDLKFSVRSYPDQPVHLSLIETDPNVVTVIESIQSLHGKPITLQGDLILFPKSPEIRMNIFAVKQNLPAGLNRQFTLVNFDNPDTFNQILQKCQAAWDKHPTDYVNGRNKLVSKSVQVKVSGIMNEVSPNQANPQVLISSIDDLEIVEKK